MELENKLKHLVHSIKAMAPTIDAAAKRIRTTQFKESFNKNDYNSWCQSVTGEILVKLRLFTEQNLSFIETMSVLTVTRYTFEASVWLKLFETDPRYGLVYASQLIDTQLNHWEDQRKQLVREIHLLNDLDKQQSDWLSEELLRLETMEDVEKARSESATVYHRATQMIDNVAARKFSIYADQAVHLGYSTVASMLEAEAMPQVKASIKAIKKEKASFVSALPDDIKALASTPWSWSKMAKFVGMGDEYGYIYTFTSTLMHATPASLTTDQKNLELHEMLIFFKFINIKFLDAIEASEKY
ncbi:hypothetical protein DYL61_13680 [Pseudomonas nabeulensis]|uniref:Uncharacterized protein n=1 Tax=Pseudomonas nabeulensis TaxID=2293833 RepID=A0A4Z0B4Z9_9PSED|nr:hypothetical protein [Pseudomonas nabeulensis]TFY93479.1 hypothetical protein DYL61_13680 [Pseudomonas nabeulensis]